MKKMKYFCDMGVQISNIIANFVAMFIIIAMKENTDETKKMSAGVENHYHAPVTNNNYNAPVTNYNCVGCTLNFGGDTEGTAVRGVKQITFERAEECEECEAEQAEDVDEEEEGENYEAMFPQLFRVELNLDAIVQKMIEIAYEPDYPVPYLNGIGRWFVFYKIFCENKMIEHKKGKQSMFVDFIERVFGWPQETRKFSKVVPSYYLNYHTSKWPSGDKYAAMADYVRSAFIEGSFKRRQLRKDFLKEDRWIDINLK